MRKVFVDCKQAGAGVDFKLIIGEKTLNCKYLHIIFFAKLLRISDESGGNKLDQKKDKKEIRK